MSNDDEGDDGDFNVDEDNLHAVEAAQKSLLMQSLKHNKLGDATTKGKSVEATSAISRNGGGGAGISGTVATRDALGNDAHSYQTTVPKTGLVDGSAADSVSSASANAAGASLLRHRNQALEPNRLLPPSNLDIYSSGMKHKAGSTETATSSGTSESDANIALEVWPSTLTFGARNDLDDLGAIPQEGATPPPSQQQVPPTTQVGATSLSIAMKLAQISPVRQAVALDFAKAVVLVPTPMHFTTTSDDTGATAAAASVDGTCSSEVNGSTQSGWRHFTAEELKKCAFVDLVPRSTTNTDTNTALHRHLGLDPLDPQLMESAVLARASPGCASVAKYYRCSSESNTTGTAVVSSGTSSSLGADEQQQPRRRVRRFFGLGRNGDRGGGRGASESSTTPANTSNAAPVAVHLLHVCVAERAQENLSGDDISGGGNNSRLLRNQFDLQREALADALQAVLASFVASGLRVLRLPAHRLFVEATRSRSFVPDRDQQDHQNSTSPADKKKHNGDIGIDGRSASSLNQQHQDEGPRLLWEALQLAFAQLSLSERARAAARRVELCVVHDDDGNGNDLLLSSTLKDLAAVGFTLNDFTLAAMAGADSATPADVKTIRCTADAVVDKEEKDEVKEGTNHQSADIQSGPTMQAPSLVASLSPPVSRRAEVIKHAESTAAKEGKLAELSQVKEEEEETKGEDELHLSQQQSSFDGEELLHAELQRGELPRAELHSPLLMERTQLSGPGSNSQNNGRNAPWARAPTSSNSLAGASFLNASVMSPFGEPLPAESSVQCPNRGNHNMQPVHHGASPDYQGPVGNCTFASHPNNSSMAGSAVSGAGSHGGGSGDGSDREAMVEELVRVRGTLRRVLSSLKVSVRGTVSKSSSANASVRKNGAKGQENKPPVATAGAANTAAAAADPNECHEELKKAPGMKKQGRMKSSALDVSSPPPLPHQHQHKEQQQHEALRAENERLSKALAARDEELLRRKQLADLQSCLHDLNHKHPTYVAANHAQWESEPETF
jgi:hypothetical protein